MYTVRIFFQKTGSAKYISHLDLMRTFERVFRRAGVPLWYTEGYNPRPFLSFAVPLSLGTTGLREAVDFRLTQEMPFDEIECRLNGCMPEGLRVTEVTEPKNKITAIAASDYSIELSAEGMTAQELCSAAEKLFGKDSIVITKLNKKKKQVDVDIRPQIKRYSFELGENGDALLHITLPSGCSENCNPLLVLSAISDFTGAKLISSITREKLLLEELRDFC